uniref:Uncharacterized protein n=1 Tax=Chrysotila carterae TaxID=13221 RepID=A0A7S4C0J7_CHRCT
MDMGSVGCLLAQGGVGPFEVAPGLPPLPLPPSRHTTPPAAQRLDALQNVVGAAHCGAPERQSCRSVRRTSALLPARARAWRHSDRSRLEPVKRGAFRSCLHRLCTAFGLGQRGSRSGREGKGRNLEGSNRRAWPLLPI